MYLYRCKVLKILDGDTVDVDIDLGFGVWLRKQRIRLDGVDTPESRTRDPVEKIYGLAAKRKLTEWLVGDVMIQTHKDERGKFGRILGTFMANGANINQKLINAGYAVAYHGQAKADIEAQHLANRKRLNLHGIKPSRE